MRRDLEIVVDLNDSHDHVRGHRTGSNHSGGKNTRGKETNKTFQVPKMIHVQGYALTRSVKSSRFQDHQTMEGSVEANLLFVMVSALNKYLAPTYCVLRKQGWRLTPGRQTK